MYGHERHYLGMSGSIKRWVNVRFIEKEKVNVIVLCVKDARLFMRVNI